MSEKDSNGAEQAVLLPCPFCGGKATVCIGFAAFIDVEIHCDDCSMAGPNFDEQESVDENRAEAVAAWNTRA